MVSDRAAQALHARFETIRCDELDRLRKKVNGLPPEGREVLEAATRAIVDALDARCSALAKTNPVMLHNVVQLFGADRPGSSLHSTETGEGVIMKRVVAGLATFAFALLVASTAHAQDAAKIAKGEQLYTAQKCALCHSIGDKGNKKGPLDGVGTKLKADEIKEWLVDPKTATAKAKADRKPPMKAYATLPAADIDALVAYLQSLKK